MVYFHTRDCIKQLGAPQISAKKVQWLALRGDSQCLLDSCGFSPQSRSDHMGVYEFSGGRKYRDAYRRGLWQKQELGYMAPLGNKHPEHNNPWGQQLHNAMPSGSDPARDRSCSL